MSYRNICKYNNSSFITSIKYNGASVSTGPPILEQTVFDGSYFPTSCLSEAETRGSIPVVCNDMLIVGIVIDVIDVINEISVIFKNNNNHTDT